MNFGDTARFNKTKFELGQPMQVSNGRWVPLKTVGKWKVLPRAWPDLQGKSEVEAEPAKRKCPDCGKNWLKPRRRYCETCNRARRRRSKSAVKLKNAA